MLDHVSIHTLLTQLKQGQDEALDILYPRYARVFYTYAKHRGLSHEDAEDIVQSTFWRVLDRIASYDESNGGGERWIWRICQHLVIDALRIKGTVELPDDDTLVEESGLEEYVETQEQFLAIEQAWNALAETDRNELRRGRGRGPGRKAWHAAIQRMRTLCFMGGEG